jgi:hypothetical protein
MDSILGNASQAEFRGKLLIEESFRAAEWSWNRLQFGWERSMDSLHPGLGPLPLADQRLFLWQQTAASRNA